MKSMPSVSDRWPLSRACKVVSALPIALWLSLLLLMLYLFVTGIRYAPQLDPGSLRMPQFIAILLCLGTSLVASLFIYDLVQSCWIRPGAEGLRSSIAQLCFFFVPVMGIAFQVSDHYRGLWIAGGYLAMMIAFWLLIPCLARRMVSSPEEYRKLTAAPPVWLWAILFFVGAGATGEVFMKSRSVELGWLLWTVVFFACILLTRIVRLRKRV